MKTSFSMLQKVIFKSVVSLMLSCLTLTAFGTTDLVKIGISVEIKATERCDIAYALENVSSKNSNQSVSTDCDIPPGNLEQVTKYVETISTVISTQEKHLRVVKTAQ